jgi:hypothetical protein
MSSFVKFLLILATSSIKFLFAPPLSFCVGFNFLQTWAFTSVGGVTGVLVFFFLGRFMLKIYAKYYREAFKDKIHALADRIGKLHLAERLLPKNPKIFSWQNKLIARIRMRWGFIGIIVLTPVLFSIPIGTLLAISLYSDRKYLPVYLSASVVVWSLLLSSTIAIF